MIRHRNEIINIYNNHHAGSNIIDFLCCVFHNTKYEFFFDKYWNAINDKKYLTISSYLKIRRKTSIDKEERDLLRLMILHDFINYMEEKDENYAK